MINCLCTSDICFGNVPESGDEEETFENHSSLPRLPTEKLQKDFPLHNKVDKKHLGAEKGNLLQRALRNISDLLDQCFWCVIF